MKRKGEGPDVRPSSPSGATVSDQDSAACAPDQAGGQEDG